MDLMGTELARIRVLQSSTLYRLADVDSFTPFALPVFIKEARRKCVTAGRALSVGTGSFLLASSKRRCTVLSWTFHIIWKMRNTVVFCTNLDRV